MPIQDGKYVAPEWKNGQPPAINAQELNDNLIKYFYKGDF